MEGAELRFCVLSLATLFEADVEGAKLADAIFDRTLLAKVDLSMAKGLSAAHHKGPSTIGTDTIERTLAAARGDAKRRQDCVNFFRGAGIAEHLLEHYRHLGDPRQPYVRTHIIYERSDKDFARMLYDELQAWGVRCWLEERDSRTDEWSVIVNQIGWMRDRVILCASAAAMKGKWAPDVIATAVRDVEIGRDFLIVVDLDGCLRKGWRGEHAWWIRSRVAVDFSRLESGAAGAASRRRWGESARGCWPVLALELFLELEPMVVDELAHRLARQLGCLGHDPADLDSAFSAAYFLIASPSPGFSRTAS